MFFFFGKSLCMPKTKSLRLLSFTNLKCRGWCRVQVEHVAGGGWRGRVRSNGDAGLRLAKSGSVEELGGSLEAVGGGERLSHGI